MQSSIRLSCAIFATTLLFTLPASAMEIDLDLSNFTGVWTFDGANPLADVSGNGNNLQLPGAAGNQPTFVTSPSSNNGYTPFATTRSYDTPFVFNGAGNPYVPGPTGASAQFDGNDWLTIPSGTYTGGDFTFVAGVRRTRTSGWATILGSERFRFAETYDGGSGEYRSLLFQWTNGVSNGSGGVASYPVASPGIPGDDWYFTVARYDDTTGSIQTYFVTDNGALVPVASGTVNPRFDATGTGAIGPMNLGYENLSQIGGVDPFQGQMDFILFDNNFLSDTELGQVYDFFNFGPLAPPVPLTPEPGTLALFGIAVVGLAGWMSWRRKKHA